MPYKKDSEELENEFIEKVKALDTLTNLMHLSFTGMLTASKEAVNNMEKYAKENQALRKENAKLKKQLEELLMKEPT